MLYKVEAQPITKKHIDIIRYSHTQHTITQANRKENCYKRTIHIYTNNFK